MATIDITSKTFESVLDTNEIVLIDFWAGWCAPCRMFAPTYSAASDKHPDVAFAKVDTEAEQTLAAQAGISSIPTLMAFRDKVLVFSQPGAIDAAALEQVITDVRALDMQAIRDGLVESKSRVGS
ncbi:thioredoxin domain-containing protein [Arthrobacter sp. H5]|uniref:thioredoxin family protein n=1 Tax=Arthrobacter sp. H5 TaxID=1267973 RepID=UPI0004801FD5|nr:thioredoxin domain-containing protein [Arthrobacter sp. H5]